MAQIPQMLKFKSCHIIICFLCIYSAITLRIVLLDLCYSEHSESFWILMGEQFKQSQTKEIAFHIFSLTVTIFWVLLWRLLCQSAQDRLCCNDKQPPNLSDLRQNSASRSCTETEVLLHGSYLCLKAHGSFIFTCVHTLFTNDSYMEITQFIA